MRTTTDALQRAIDHLDAVEVAPGRYAHRDDSTRRYYIVAGAEMEALPRYLDDDPAGGYSLWCAETHAVEMPAWWKPERREAWYVYVSDPAGWEESCPDWQEVFFGSPGDFCGCLGYSDDLRSLLFGARKDAHAAAVELGASGDWETPEGDMVQPEYRVGGRITVDLETGEEIPA